MLCQVCLGYLVVAGPSIYTLGGSHDGMVLLGILFMCLLALMSVKHLVVGWARRVLART